MSTETPLGMTQVAASGDAKALEVLLLGGGDVDALCEVTKCRALHAAAHFGRRECVDLLIRYNADVNVQCCKGQTPLMGAISGGHHQCMFSLLRGGVADATISDDQGNNAAHYAALNGATQPLYEMKRRNSPALTAKNLKGETPLDVAVAHNHTSCVNCLQAMCKVCLGQKKGRGEKTKHI